MKSEMIRIEPIALLPTPAGCALFLGDGEKVVLIYIDPSIGASINMVLAGDKPPRPLTHDLFSDALTAFGGKVVKVTIIEADGDVYFARMFIQAENEIMQKKIVELDARPSDSIAMAARAGAPIYVVNDVWEQMQDVSDILEKMKEGSEGFGGIEGVSDD